MRAGALISFPAIFRRAFSMSQEPMSSRHVAPLLSNMPLIIKVSEVGENGAIEAVKKVLTDGGVIGVPTDTIYGIAGLACNKEVIERIYEIKRRDAGKPLAMCVGDYEELYSWCVVTVKKELLCELLPGPVTLVFDRKQELNAALNPGVSRIGVRVPKNDFIRGLAASVGPLALTSANFSSEPSTLSVQEFKELWPLLDAVVDGGPLRDTPLSRNGSTVVDLSSMPYYSIIRQGCAYENTVNILKSYGLRETGEEKIGAGSKEEDKICPQPAVPSANNSRHSNRKRTAAEGDGPLAVHETKFSRQQQ